MDLQFPSNLYFKLGQQQGKNGIKGKGLCLFEFI
jgi:hypothetical protein